MSVAEWMFSDVNDHFCHERRHIDTSLIFEVATRVKNLPLGWGAPVPASAPAGGVRDGAAALGGSKSAFDGYTVRFTALCAGLPATVNLPIVVDGRRAHQGGGSEAISEAMVRP